jgi:hypothetical protein
MRTICAAGLAVSLSLWSGCSAPGKTTLRIGITESAGATLLYFAEELNLYREYGVNPRIVELPDHDALEHAFNMNQVDAVVLPHERCVSMIKNSHSDAGVLLVLAIAKSADSSSRWQTEQEELLLVHRAEVMRRRSEWRDLLEAYEHARLSLTSRPDSIAAALARREHRFPSELAREISMWNFFGVSEQDSLLDFRGELKDLDARWQGNLDFASGSARKRDDRRPSATESDQPHSR